MRVRGVIRDYVKEFYDISYNNKEKQILLHDEYETFKTRSYIDIGRVGRVKITLVWGKIEEVTGIQYHHKEYQSELSRLFFEIITEKVSKEFFKLLLDENIPVRLSVKEVIDSFPILKD